jgi:hypothetical protein
MHHTNLEFRKIITARQKKEANKNQRKERKKKERNISKERKQTK